MKNVDVRSAAASAGVKWWEIANELLLHPATLSVKLRQELPEQEKKRIFSAIDAIRARGRGAA